MTNNELGWKASGWNQCLQWNGAAYQEDWHHAQIGALDADVLRNGVINGGNYSARGVETSVMSRMGMRLSLEMGAAWNHSELVKEATFFSRPPARTL